MKEIFYKLSSEELYYGLVALARTRIVTQVFRILGMVLIGIVAFTTVVTLKNGNFTANTGFVITIILALYGYFLPEISAKIQAPAIAKAKSPVTEDIKLRLGQHQYILAGETFTNKLSYEKLHSAIETDRFFLLKKTEGSADFVPKRAFTPEQIIQFREILSAVPGLKTKLQ